MAVIELLKEAQVLQLYLRSRHLRAEICGREGSVLGLAELLPAPRWTMVGKGNKFRLEPAPEHRAGLRLLNLKR